MPRSVLLVLIVLLWTPGLCFSGETIFTYRTPESPTDMRYAYDTAVLRLALEKTREKWGEYRMVPSPVMNYSRAVGMMEAGTLENPMFKLSASDDWCGRFAYAPFPVDLGIVGFRLFFVSDRADEELSQVGSLQDLKQFSLGQGFGWLDGMILRSSGFTVVEIPKYESLFRMVASGRFDLFPRGINEVGMEYEAHKTIPYFKLNREVGLYYPLPRFFFTHKDNRDAIRRVHEGLKLAYEDGSLQELWEKEYRASIEFGNFEGVRFFEIENPFLSTVDSRYEKYMLHAK